MSALALKARSSWLFSFGDLVTLLITFFIMMIVLNKGEISQVQKWAESQLDTAYAQLTTQMADAEYVSLSRTANGISVNISHPEAFVKGGYNLSSALESELTQLGKALQSLKIFHLERSDVPIHILRIADADSLSWRSEVSVAGYTDDDQIDPQSPLRNNWFLSTMRAQNVMKSLYQSSELKQSQFGVTGYGKYRPVASNETREGKAKNRRVQVMISATFEKSATQPAWFK
uniref:OmpA/MotB family protein n=1 Tax=Hydrogenovibrio crunogenus (strain DSM 25203 / XCL-2) TaxID=317025 RepID=Q31IR7_HYDCU